jgi:DNA-binding transcriptional LysR family regulator
MNNNALISYALSFSAVVKAGSFSRAAKKAGVSKAQLSKHVSALESLLGIQLLYRTTRTMALTEHGKQFFSSCETIEENCAEAINHLKHDFSSMQGTLKITAPIDFGIQFLPSIIHEFSKQYPAMNAMVSLSNIDENLTEQNFDVAIRIANKLPDSNLRVYPILKFKRIICVSACYLKNKAMPNDLEELKNHVCITSVNRNISIIYPQWQFLTGQKKLNLKLEKFIEIDSLFAQLELIKLGAGVGRLPDYFIKKELKKGEIIEIFPHIEKPTTYIYLLYPNTPVLPKKTRVFIDFIKMQISNLENNT